MKMFFENCKTLDELKAEYRRLSKIYHPDLGGDLETMKQINAQYETAFDALNASSDEPKAETAADFINIINALVKLQGITIELCGSWLWISGDTKAVKEELKAAGCRWASKKSMWYWHPADWKPANRKTATMEHIRQKYGSKIISSGSRSRSGFGSDKLTA